MPLDPAGLVFVGVHYSWLDNHDVILLERIVIEPVRDGRLTLHFEVNLLEPVDVRLRTAGAW